LPKFAKPQASFGESTRRPAAKRSSVLNLRAAFGRLFFLALRPILKHQPHIGDALNLLANVIAYWYSTHRAREVGTLDALIGRQEILGGLIATAGGCIAASRTSGLKRLVYIWIAAVVLLVSIGETAAQPKSGETAAQPKKILFLYSYGSNIQPWATWGREISKELVKQSRWPLDIQEQSVVTARNGDDVADAKLVEYLRALYAQRPPDLIIAVSSPAANFVQQHRADLFPTTPMLLAAVEVRRVDQSMFSEQDAVAAVRTDYVVLFENILRLLPETKTIAIVSGNSPAEQFWMDVVRRVSEQG
jgi:hypothetical protein